jgi:hypothetical protein
MANRESDLGARAIVARPALRENWRFAAWRFVLAGFGAVALAGCASVSNTLSPQEVAGLKLTGVAVTFTPEAAVQWEDGQRLYAASKGVSYPQIGQPVDAAEEKAYLRNALTPKLKAAMEKNLAATLHGSRPVRLEVTVRNFDISPPLQRAVLGGGYSMLGDVNLVDARTGAVIIAYPNLSAFLYAGNGVLGATVQAIVDANGQAPADRVVDEFASKYGKWLAQQST